MFDASQKVHTLLSVMEFQTLSLRWGHTLFLEAQTLRKKVRGSCIRVALLLLQGKAYVPNLPLLPVSYGQFDEGAKTDAR